MSEAQAARDTGVAKAAGVVMVLILISRLLGFVRERAIAEVFGRNWETDAFRAAFNIPDLMYILLVAGAISAAFIPVFTDYLAKGKEAEAWRMASTFINGVGLLLVLLTVLGVIFTPFLAPLVAYRFAGDQLDLLVFLMRMMFPAVFFTALAGMAMGVHNSYRHFATPMAGPIFYNVAIILGAYLLGPHIGITGMAVGTVVGAVGNFLIQAPFVLATARRYPWIIDFSHPGIRRVLKLMLPALAGLSIFQINIIIATNLASGLPEGSITALNLANRLMQLPLGVFAMAISTVIFPTLTRLAAQGELDDFRDTLSFGLRGVLFVTIPSAAGLLALGTPMVRLLFEVGEFLPQDTVATAYALTFFAVGLIGLSGVQVLTRVFYSLQDPATPVKVGVLAVAVNLGLSLIFLRATDLEHGGLALAFSVAALVQMTALLLLLRKRLGQVDGRRIGGTVARAGAAAMVMAAAVYVAAEAVGGRVDLTTSTGRLVQVFAGLGVGAAVYGMFALVFRMEEADFVRSLARRALRRKQGSETG